MASLDLHGTAQLRRAAMQMRDMANRQWRRRIVGAVERGVKPLENAIRAEVGTLPSGYAPTMARALRTTTSVNVGASRGVTVRVWAKGKAEQRDVRSVDAGRLRHPLHGNRRKWYSTAVTPGFVDRPWEATKPDVERSVDRELGDIVTDLERG